MRLPGVGTLALSLTAAKLALATLAYGVMVFLAAQGAAQWQVSVVAATTYLSAVLFGIQGGLLADAVPKRLAIAAAYAAIGVACVILPWMFGTGVGQLLVLMFLASALMQVIIPALKAAVALVAEAGAVATVSADVYLVGSIASSFGASLLAPVIIKISGIEVLLGVVAAVLMVGSVISLRLPRDGATKSFRRAIAGIDWQPAAFSVQRTADWYLAHRASAALILVGSIAVALYEAFNTLIPVYVRDVLGSDPTNAVYIFAPSGIGFLAGVLLTPWLIGKVGPRRLATMSVTIMSVSMVMFGLIDLVAPLLAPLSPLRLVEWALDISINQKVLAAGVISIPANFGSAATGAAVQTYINVRVPVSEQGAAYGQQEVQENLLTLVLVLSLGIISTFTGARFVFVLAPVVAFLVIMLLIRYSLRLTRNPVHRGDAWRDLMGRDAPSDSNGDM